MSFLYDSHSSHLEFCNIVHMLPFLEDINVLLILFLHYREKMRIKKKNQKEWSCIPASKLGLILPCRRKTKRRHLSPLPFKDRDKVSLWAQGWTSSWSSSNAVASQDPEETCLSCHTSPRQVALASKKLQGWRHCQDRSMKNHQCRNRQWERTFIHQQPVTALALAVPAASFPKFEGKKHASILTVIPAGFLWNWFERSGKAQKQF